MEANSKRSVFKYHPSRRGEDINKSIETFHLIAFGRRKIGKKKKKKQGQIMSLP